MNDRDNDLLWKSYFYPGTKVLINNMGIKDRDSLKEFDATYSFERLLELRQEYLDIYLISFFLLKYILVYIILSNCLGGII